ncbi:hypothetical protein LXL04_034671 [Taraxacum kok-saghyz]
MLLPLPRSADENAPLLRLFPSPSAVVFWYLRRSLFSISISDGFQIFSVTFIPVGIGTPIGCGSLISSSLSQYRRVLIMLLKVLVAVFIVNIRRVFYSRTTFFTCNQTVFAK